MSKIYRKIYLYTTKNKGKIFNYKYEKLTEKINHGAAFGNLLANKFNKLVIFYHEV